MTDPTITPASDEQIASLAISPGTWEAARLWDETINAPLAGDAAKTYVIGCIDLGGPDFFAVLVEKPDGPADVCHTGNGPTSWENAKAIAMLPRLIARIEADRATIAKQAEEIERLRGSLAALVRMHFHPDGRPYEMPAHEMRVIEDARAALSKEPGR